MTTHHRHHRKLLLFLFFFISCQQISGQNISDYCPESKCGGIVVRYPFWDPSKKVLKDESVVYQYCGYKNLRVSCKENKSLTLATLAHEYTVTEINYENHTISLVDTDVLGEDCPKVQDELNISNISVLEFNSAVVNLTFFFNCTNNITGNPAIPLELRHQSTCLNDRYPRTLIVVGEVKSELSSLLSRLCTGKVVAPVMKKGVNDSNVSKSFPNFLKEGFQLDWSNKSKYRECRKCEDSGGYCGYLSHTREDTDLERVCFCKDGPPRSGDCNSGGGSKKKIVIGVCIPASFVVCVAVAFWYWRKHKNHTRRKLSGEFPLVRSISSDQWGMSMDTQYQSSNHLAHIFTYKELEDATNGFHPSNEIGDGGFGTVYKGEIRDGRTVAVKLLYGNNYKRMEQFMNEILILSRLRHPNLVTLYGCTSRQCRELLLVYEFVANGTVADHLHGSRADDKSLSWPVRMRIAMETASALAYLHASEPQIVHRDVKTHNILLDKDFHVKVADFGLSRLFPTTDVSHVSTAPQGTPGYVDPEYHQCYQLTDKSDVYSFGVVLAELISSKPAVDITRSRSEINLSGMATSKIRDGLLHELADPELRFESDPDVTRMIRSVAELAFLCLQGEKDLRPCMEEVKNELMKTAGGGGVDGEVYIDVEKSPKDDAYLLHFSGPYSPDTVTAQWKSRSTTPNTSA